jgi:hypothetical protein
LAAPKFKLERKAEGEKVTWSVFACCDMSRFLHPSPWYHFHLGRLPKIVTDLRTAEPAATMREGSAQVLHAAADAEQFLSVLPAKKISSATNAANPWKAAANESFPRQTPISNPRAALT